MVINSYDESYSSKQVFTLLVNEALKRDYDEALKEVGDKRALLIKVLAKSSGKQNNATPELICEAFDRPEKEFLDLLSDIKSQNTQDHSGLANFKCGDLFHPIIIIGRKGSVGAITWASEGGWIIDIAYYVEIKDNSKLDLRYLFHTFSRIDVSIPHNRAIHI